MTKAKFDEAYKRAVSVAAPANAEDIMAELSNYASDPSSITLIELATYLRVESMKYTNKLIYTLLSDVLVDSE